MDKYMLIKSLSAKVPLVSGRSKSKEYECKFGERSVTLSLSVEAWLVAKCFDPNEQQCVLLWLRGAAPGLTPLEIDQFFATIDKDHPRTSVNYYYKDVPAIATETEYLEMPVAMFKEPILLTLQEEREMLDIIAGPCCNVSKLARIKNKFQQIRYMRGYEARLKRDKAAQDDELAGVFCWIHGIPPCELHQEWVLWQKALDRRREITRLSQEQKGKSTWDSFKWGGITVALLLGIYTPCVALGSFLAAWSDEVDSLFLEAIMTLTAMVLIFAPLSAFFQFLKNGAKF